MSSPIGDFLLNTLTACACIHAKTGPSPVRVRVYTHIYKLDYPKIYLRYRKILIGAVNTLLIENTCKRKFFSHFWFKSYTKSKKSAKKSAKNRPKSAKSVRYYLTFLKFQLLVILIHTCLYFSIILLVSYIGM